MNRMRLFTYIVVLILFHQSAAAQLYSTQYRLPGQEWMELNTERFRLIYPKRYHQEAVRSLTILEHEYEDIRDRVGGGLSRFPIIINPENDRSNGFVAPLNFRSEIELSPIIGKTMNPASGGWLEMVLPHELVHALHFSVNPSSVTRVAGLFSPDVRRSVHSAAPMGVFEGMAVYYESHHRIPGAGRGNYPYFTNRFESVLHTPEEWSMGQLLIPSEYTLPFDRHYIGGYKFSNWLLDAYGADAVKNAIRYHYKYPFLGYGTALRATTGKWPRGLYREFSKAEQARYAEKTGPAPGGSQTALTRSGDLSAGSIQLAISGSCRRVARPKWISNHEIVYYGRFCNRPFGFYLYNLSTDENRLLLPVSLTPDHTYAISEDRREIFYSRYHVDALYHNVYQGDLHSFNLETGKKRRMTKGARLYAPHLAGNKIYLLHPEGSRMALVFIRKEDPQEVIPLEQSAGSSAEGIAIHPFDHHLAALIGKVKSVQGIWFENLSEEPVLFSRPPDIAFKNGSVFDIQWDPSGEHLHFISDQNGVMNLYSYSLSDQTVYQDTNSNFNVLEPDIHPEEQTFAYIRQTVNEELLYVGSGMKGEAISLEESVWQPDQEILDRLERPLMNREGTPLEFTMKEYKTGLGWLRPRIWVPWYDRVAGRNEFSLRAESVDVMSSRQYDARFSYYAGRPWFDITFDYKEFFPGFSTSIYNEPVFTALNVQDNQGNEVTHLLLQQSRGALLKIPVRLQLRSDVRFSSLLLEPRYSVSQVRFFDEASTSQPRSDFGTRHTVGLRSVLNLGLRQFTRDVQPNGGLVLHAESLIGLNADQITIDAGPSKVEGSLTQRRGIRAGMIGYLSPLSRWNQSLRVSAEVFSQTDTPVFGVLSRFSDLFGEYPVIGANNLAIVDTRYTIPLTYPDQGGVLVPFYLSNIYMVLFSQSVADLDRQDWFHHSRTVLGAGIRSRFKFGNIHLDVGIAVGWEPGQNQFNYHIGSF